MMTDCVVRSRIDQHIKLEAMQMFEHMGLTISEAIRLFIYKAVAEKCIPFSINVPNSTTRKALQAARAGEQLEVTSLEQLEKDWNDACAK
jgi:DNA-damage-inducible protein J